MAYSFVLRPKARRSNQLRKHRKRLPSDKLGAFQSVSSDDQLLFAYTPSLQASFRVFTGFGPGREKALVDAGIASWTDLATALEAGDLPFRYAAKRRDSLLREIEKARAALERRDAKHFARALPRAEWHKLIECFPERVVYLDIETTGLSHYYDHITLVGAALGKDYGCYVAAPDKARLSNIVDIVRSGDLVVTYNGTLFDIPFIERQLPEVQFPPYHFDLRYACKRLNLTGGQKAIERELGIGRSRSISNLSGEKAPLLWHNYKLGSLDDLKTLIRYNASDIEGLRRIAWIVAARMSGSSAQNPLQPLPEPRFVADADDFSDVLVRPFPRTENDHVHFDHLVDRMDLKPIRIVGIDLTGSEARASGWALLEGSNVSTQLVNSDEDLIALTVKYQPTLVSIDSPLSLPDGRIRVTDDDPGRDAFGIMRSCERILKARGVNVYPSLLPSMQRLTARGIKLAGTLRKLGVPVLESYPGAAQDIMGIPRKQAGLEYLAQGLRDFGICSDDLLSARSHDELDAVTAAAVGLFFWGGRFEAIGTESEDYLIIPSVTAEEESSPRLVVGLSGRISAGKSTAAAFLKEIGFASTRFSAVLQEMLESDGLEPTREALQEIGQRVHKSPGQRWLCRQTVLRHAEARVLVVDGLRFPMDHATLTEMFGADFIHLHILAHADARRERYVASGGSTEEFEEASKHPVESRIWALRHLADASILNNEDLEGFREAIQRAILEAVGKKVKGSRCRSRLSLVDSLAPKARARSRSTS